MALCCEEQDSPGPYSLDLCTFNFSTELFSPFIVAARQAGVHPLDTLQTKSGTFRDFALFMKKALRRLVITARFVSGYILHPREGETSFGEGSIHASVQAYLPSAGWVEFDPTNGILGSRDLIRIAVARDPRQALPLHGTYSGSRRQFLDAYKGLAENVDKDRLRYLIYG